jgi:thiol-disulfide isomerase/thioredoxin
MNRTIRNLLFVLAVAVPTTAAADPGATLSGHRLLDLAGNARTLGELRGRVVVVNFWASWCTPCRKELPVFEAWNRELPDEEVAFAAISIDQERRNAERFVQRAGLTLPVYHDGVDGLARSLDLPYLPCTYVLDADGKVAFVSSGATDEKLAELRRVIDDLRSARPMQAELSGGQP